MFDVAAHVLEDESQSVDFVFMGDGPLREPGERRFADDPRVSFSGWRSQQEVQQLLQTTSVVLVPMSGYVLIEAAAQGKAVVVSDIEWHTEMVQDEVNGVVVGNSRDVNEWAAAVFGLLQDPERASRLGAELRRTYDASYHPSITAWKQRQMYVQLARRWFGPRWSPRRTAMALRDDS